jgi:hypothetical protein
MRRTYLLVAASSLFIAALVRADPPTQAPSPTTVNAVYEGLDDQGRVVRLTLPDVRVETFERVSPPATKRYPEPHWSARFGTGGASALER